MNISGIVRLQALVCLFIALLLASPEVHAAAGDLDSLDVTIGGGTVVTTVVQPDGKILIGGSFTSVAGVPRNKIARLNGDGTLDSAFNPTANDTVESIVVQEDGKLVVGGYFTTLQPGATGPVVTRGRIARLHADGTLDTTFYPNADREVLSMTVQADGKIVIAGRFGLLQPNGAATPSTRTKIARLNPDGTLDAGFAPTVASGDIYTIAMQGDGKILVAGNFSGIGGMSRSGNARLNANGTVDTSYTSGVAGTVNSIAVQADGKVLIGGDYFGMARLNDNGSRDTAFSPNPNDRVYSMAVQADGKIVIGGYFTVVRSTLRYRIARLNADGTLDTGFNPTASGNVNCVALQADGQILLGGDFVALRPNGAPAPTPRAGFARLLNDPATQGVTVPTLNQASWTRGGSSPDLARVRFELSTDNGSTWTSLGSGSRVGVTSSWQIAGLSLPASGRIRAQGVTSDGNGSTGGLVGSAMDFSGVTPLPKIAVFTGDGSAAVNERVDNFGIQLLGDVPQTFTIKNTGLTDLTGLALTLSGDAPGDYVLGSSGATTLAPGATTTFTVTFAPTAIGARNAVVNVASSDTEGGTFRINVANLTPEVAVRGNNVNIANGDSSPAATDGTDFGSVSISGVGSTLTRSFVIANTGAANLMLGTISIGGENAADFSVGVQPASPVAPGGSRSFTVTFDPGGLGLRSAIVSFGTDDPDETLFSFSLQGTGFVSGNANLSGLSLSAGTLAPVFSPATTSYIASVAYGDGSLIMRPTKEEANASITVRINGGGEVGVLSDGSSYALALDVGMNVIDVKVTAQDGSTRTYMVSVTRVVASPGNIDPLDLNMGLGSEVYAMAAQPDGKTIIAGSFYTVLGEPRGNIARLNADGTLDADFNPYVTGSIFSVAVQGDGKILLGGSFSKLQPNGSAVPVTRNSIARLNADGTLDTGFNPNADAAVRGMALQPDGKVVIGGDFSTLQPNGAAVATARNRIARLNADGTLDGGFDPRANNQVACVVLQGDGKLLLGGAFTTFQPNGGTTTSRFYVARLNADGTVDGAFNPRASGFVASMALQADGKVVLGGDFVAFQPNGATSITIRNRIARVNTDGTLDAGFDPNANGRVSSVAVQADGSILMGGSFYTLRPNGAASAISRSRIARVYSNGGLDFSFNPNADGNVHAVAQQLDGQVLLGGSFRNFQPNGAVISIARYGFARLFNDPAPQGLTATSASRIEWLRGGAAPEVGQVNFEVSTDRGTTYVPLGAGTRISGGWELTGLSLPAGQIRARGRTSSGYFNSSGGMVEMVSSFGVAATPEMAVIGNSVVIPNGAVTPVPADHTDFGNVVLSGIGSTLTRTFTVANIGTADLTVGSVVVSGPDAADFIVSKQPGPLVAGSRSTTFAITFDPSDPGLRSATVSFTSSDADEGSFSFNLQGTGYLSSNADLSELLLTPSLAGLQPAFSSATTAYTAGVAYGDSSLRVSPWKVDANASISARVNGGIYGDVMSASSSEPLNLNVGPNTVEVRVTAQDGKIKIYTVTVVRAEQGTGDLHSLDASVTGDAVYAMAVQPDGKTIIAGAFSFVMGVPRRNIARLNPDGSLDTGFDPQANDVVYRVVLQADGKVLIGGWFTTLQPNNAATATARNRVARLNADGTLDTGFNPNANSYVSSMALQTDGKVLLGGAFTTLQPNGAASATTRKYMARVNADGSLDTGFDPSPSGNVSAITVQADDKVLLGGSFITLQPNGAASATSRQYIARVNGDGTLDAGFDPKANNHVLSVVVQADGKVLLGGGFTTLQPNGATSTTARKYIARMHADGSLDTSFDPSASYNVLSLAVQADGRIVVGGEFDAFQPNGAVEPVWRGRVARLNADGTVDSAFRPNANLSVQGVALEADGQVLLAGHFSEFRPNGAFAINHRFRFARILNEPAMQSLGVPDATRINWVRGGTSPDFSQVTFELSTDGGSSYTVLGNASRVGSTANWQLTGLSLPASGLVRARGRMMSGNSSGLVEAVVPIGNSSIPIEMWRASYFGSSANSGHGADAFDFDQDGLVNLIEYAFGLNPTQSELGQLPQAERAGGNFVISFSQPTGVSSITYGAEWSEDLTTWTPVPDTGILPQHTFSVPMAGKKALYMRLSITAP